MLEHTPRSPGSHRRFLAPKASSLMTTSTVPKSVPYHIPFIRKEEIRAVTETLKSGWITTGPQTRCFEKHLARFIDVRHAIAASSCTAALHLSVEEMRPREGDEVLVPTLTFAATTGVVAYFKAKPVLVDVDPLYFNLSLEDAQRKITSKTRQGSSSM